MAREKKDYYNLHCKLDCVISDRLDRYCKIMGQTKTMAIERILEAAFDRYDKEQSDPEKRTI